MVPRLAGFAGGGLIDDFNKRARTIVALGTLALLVVACAPEKRIRPTEIRTAVRRNYLKGLVELEDGDDQQAMRLFNEVATSPRHFRYTALASLRAADTLFYQEQYAQAVVAYQGFIKRFAGDPNIPYAEFRIAQSHYERLPGDWFFMPPAYERELATTRSAYDVLSRFLRRYPRHRFAVMARRMHTACAQRLYDNEIYVTDFYEGRDRPRGSAQRLETALERFPELALTEENFLRLARAYVEAEDASGAVSALERFLAHFPEGGRAEEVRGWLEELTAPPEEARDEETTELSEPTSEGTDDTDEE